MRCVLFRSLLLRLLLDLQRMYGQLYWFLHRKLYRLLYWKL